MGKISDAAEGFEEILEMGDEHDLNIVGKAIYYSTAAFATVVVVITVWIVDRPLFKTKTKKAPQ